jgi:hypothetical protein
MASSRQIVSNLNKKVKDLEEGLIRDIAKSVERSTRANFNKAIPEVPADDPFVQVSSFSWGKSCAIECRGNQVLFIEFGAGIMNAQKELEITRGETTYSRLMLGNGFKFVDNHLHLKEVAPRPWGIVDLGMYHSSLLGKQGYGTYYMTVLNGKNYGGSQGQNDYWVYRTYNGRVAVDDSIWRISKDGNAYVKTYGIRPIRALYRGVRSGVRKEIARRIAK